MYKKNKIKSQLSTSLSVNLWVKTTAKAILMLLKYIIIELIYIASICLNKVFIVK